MVNAKSENNTIRVNVKNTSNTTTVNAASSNASNAVNAANSKTQMYEQMALGHANNAKNYAEQAKQSAINSADSALLAEQSANLILKDEGFIAVSRSLEPINTVANSIDGVSYVASNVEKIEQIVEDLNNIGDTTNINIVATNIDTVNTTANNINSVNDVADSINSVNEIAYNLTEVLNSKIYSENAKESETRALNYADNASISSDLAQEWAVSPNLVENTDYSSKYYANQAKTSATTATNQATIATNKANEAISALDSTLDYSRITNCLLEVPQNIKLELVDGTLTLKAGSKVIVPNGSGVFKDVIVQANLSTKPASTGQYMLVTSNTGSSLSWVTVSRIYSGTTDSGTGQTYHIWYDTTNNVVNLYESDASVCRSVTFPVCLFTTTADGVKSIDKVFNGFGYIGSTIWVDKGVKGLIPNGRNSDGTLNNIEHITSKISTYTNTNQAGEFLIRIDKNYISAINLEKYHISNNEPFEARTSWDVWYSPKDNLFRADGGNWDSRSFVIGGSFSVVNSKVSSLNSKQPFKAVDYNEFLNVPHVVETYRNGTSWYRVWSDDWCEQGGRYTGKNGSVTFLKPYIDTNYTITEGFGMSGGGDATAHYTIQTDTITTTGFSFKAQWTSSTSGYFYWQASGYID